MEILHRCIRQEEAPVQKSSVKVSIIEYVTTPSPGGRSACRRKVLQAPAPSLSSFQIAYESFGAAGVPPVQHIASSTDNDEVETPFSEGNPGLASLKWYDPPAGLNTIKEQSGYDIHTVDDDRGNVPQRV